MASNAAKYLNLPAKTELNGTPIGGTIFWVSTAPIPEGFLAMLGQAPSEIALYPELLKKYPNGLPNTEHDFVRGAGPNRPVGQKENEEIGHHFHSLYNGASNSIMIPNSSNPASSNLYYGMGPAITPENNNGFDTLPYRVKMYPAVADGITNGSLIGAKPVICNLSGGSDVGNTGNYTNNPKTTTFRTNVTVGETRPRNISAFYIVRAFFPNTNLSTPASVGGNLVDYLDDRYTVYRNIGYNLIDNPDFTINNIWTAEKQTLFTGKSFFTNRWKAMQVPGKTNNISCFTTPENNDTVGYLAVSPLTDILNTDNFHIVQDHGYHYIKELSSKAISFSFKYDNDTDIMLDKVCISLSQTSGGFIKNYTLNTDALLSSKTSKSFEKQIKDITITLPDLLADNNIPADTLNVSHGIRFMFYFSGMKGGKIYRFRNFKAEIGSKSTPFVPRPYVLENDICNFYYQLHFLIFTAKSQASSIGGFCSQSVPTLYKSTLVKTYSSEQASSLGKILYRDNSFVNETTFASGGIWVNAILGRKSYTLEVDFWSNIVSGLSANGVGLSWIRAYVTVMAEPELI